MFKFFFYDNDHANRYLSDTVIRIEDQPIYVNFVADYVITYTVLDAPIYANRTIELNSDRINFSPIPLGFINCKNDTTKLFRFPNRLRKIGHTRDNTRAFTITGKRADNPIFSSYLVPTAKNIFPTYKEALFKAKNKPIAFHRKFCINPTLHLYYLYFNNYIGECYKDKIVLKQKYFYLSEQLQEMGLRCEY